MNRPPSPSSIVGALARRDLVRAFGNPTGYVFITLFILLSAAAAFWQPQFFQANLANLDQINRVYPFLLVFFIPALTMGTWADERRHGTDELLFSLPAGVTSIALGKYAAALGMYTFSLLLSISHALVLVWLGSPDAGLLAANYAGYWLLGAALIPVGMLGSTMTSNGTIAFVLASLLCAVPVFLPAPFGVSEPFALFTRGLVSLATVAYFVALAAVALYLNVVVLASRSRRPGSGADAIHTPLRSASVVIALAALAVLLPRLDVRLDATVEGLHTISDETRRLLDELPDDRPVAVRAFVSPEVPEEYVQTRENLLNALREVGAIAGSRVNVTVETTEPYSAEARTARERFGIVPRLAADLGAPENRQVFLGVAMTSGANEEVIPFLERGRSAEYELVRAIRAVARTGRRTIGIVDTDARVFGGIDYASGGSNRPGWAVVNEIRRQYDVVQITPWQTIADDVDALLVVLPSTLLQHELDNVMEAVRRGVPSLLVVDPLPAMDVRLAPAASMAERVNPYAGGAALTRKNTGDIQAALRSIGIEWPPARVAWDGYRPTADSSTLPQEVIFAGPGNGTPDALNLTHPATVGLQQLMLMYPGALTPAADATLKVEPLVRTGTLSGTHGYFEIVQPSPSGPTLNVGIRREPGGEVLTLAAHVRGTDPQPVNTIVIADLDFISDAYFSLRETLPEQTSPDNLTFFLNSLDVLAGDEALIGLRSRSVRHRTLERLEARTRSFLEQRADDERRAIDEAQTALEQAQTEMSERVGDIEERSDLDAQAQAILIRNLQASELRKLEAVRRGIEQTRDARIQASREEMEAELQRIRQTIRTTAVLAPPLPVLLLGVFVFVRRMRLERESAAASRRLRES